MKTKFSYIYLFLTFLVPSCCVSQKEQQQPRVYTCDCRLLANIRKKALSRDTTLQDAINALTKKADRLLNEPKVAVTQKKSATPLTVDLGTFIVTVAYVFITGLIQSTQIPAGGMTARPTCNGSINLTRQGWAS